jgi:hypothetical protein
MYPIARLVAIKLARFRSNIAVLGLVCLTINPKCGFPSSKLGDDRRPYPSDRMETSGEFREMNASTVWLIASKICGRWLSCMVNLSKKQRLVVLYVTSQWLSTENVTIYSSQEFGYNFHL